MEKDQCLVITYLQNTKNLFTYQDTQDGYQKKKEEKHGQKQYQGILTSSKII